MATTALDHKVECRRVRTFTQDHTVECHRVRTTSLDHEVQGQKVSRFILDHQIGDEFRRFNLDHSVQGQRRNVTRLDHVVEATEPPKTAYVQAIYPAIGTPYVPVDPGALPGLFNIRHVTSLYRPWVKVHGPISGKTTAVSVANEINKGRTGNVSFIGLKDIDFGEDETFQVEMSDGAGGHKVFPPMVAESRAHGEDISGGPSTELSLMDVGSFSLSKGGRSLATFVRSTSTRVAQAIASEWGVRISNPPDYPILEEDIKDSGGWPALLRIAAVSATNLVVDQSGGIVFFHNQKRSGDVPMKIQSWRREHLPSLTYTGFQASKTSTLNGSPIQNYYFDTQGFASFQLKSPLLSVVPRDLSVSGALGYLALWNGPPSNPNSSLVAFHLMGSSPVNISVPVLGGVATHATVAIFPALDNQSAIDARLQLFGASPEPDYLGTDRAFTVQYGTGRRRKIWKEQTLPSKAFVEHLIPRYLWEASKRARPLTFSGRCDLRMDVTKGLKRTGLAANRVESVTHAHATGQAPTTSARGVMI